MKKENNLKLVNDLRITKRELPHWELAGSTYFITFNTTSGFELNEAAKEITFNAINFHDKKKYRLFACVVMSTHVHLVLSPLKKSEDSYYHLSEIIHSIKSYSTNRIQRISEQKGKIWLDEKYDRIVRNDDELFEEIRYIINNPVKAGLAKTPEEYKWLYSKC